MTLKIAIIAAESIDGIFNWTLAWLDDAGAANARYAAFVLERGGTWLFNQQAGDRIVGAWIREAPSMAARIALATGGAYCRITVANRKFV